jgi:hypothetical protein
VAPFWQELRYDKYCQKELFFMSIQKEQIRQLISQNNLFNVSDVYSFMKEGFQEILQELLEAEMEATLVYAKNQKGSVIVLCRWFKWL